MYRVNLERIGHWVAILANIGVLGGFTTFSTFAYETLELTQQSGLRALGNVGMQVALGLVAAGAGYILGKSL